MKKRKCIIFKKIIALLFNRNFQNDSNEEKKENENFINKFPNENSEADFNHEIHFTGNKTDSIVEMADLNIALKTKDEIIISKEEEIKKINNYVADELFPQIDQYKCELENLFLQNEKLNIENAEINKTFIAMQNKNEKKEKENENLIYELNNRCKVFEKKYEELLKEINILKEESKHLLQSEKFLEKENAEQAEKAKNLIQTLNENITQLTSNNDMIQFEYSEIKNEMNEKISKLEELKKENCCLLADIKNMNANNKKKEDEICNNYKSIQEQKKIVFENKQFILELRNEIKSKQNEANEQTSIIGNLKSENTRLKKDCESERNEKEKIKKENENLYQNLTNQKKIINDACNTSEQQNRYFDEENVLEKIKEERKEKLLIDQEWKKISQEQNLIEKQNFKLMEEESRITNEKEIISKQQIELLQAINKNVFVQKDHESKIEKLNEHISELNLNNKNLEREFNEMEKEIENKNSHINDHIKEIDSLKKEIENKQGLEKEKVILEMQMNINDFLIKVNNLEEEKKNLSLQLEECKNQIIKGKNKPSEEKQYEKSDNDNINKISLEENKLEKKNKALTQKFNDCQSKLEEKEVQLKNLQRLFADKTTNLNEDITIKRRKRGSYDINKNAPTTEYCEKEKKSKETKSEKIEFDFIENAIQNFFELNQIKNESTVDDELENEILKVLKQNNKTIKIVTRKLEEKN